MAAVEWFIAGRYLFSRERKALVSAITLISVAGVAVGVATLVAVIGVMDGAREVLFKKIADTFPHLQISNPREGEAFTLDPELLKNLRARREVLQAEPVLEKSGLIQTDRGIEAQKCGILLIGLDGAGHSPYEQTILQKSKVEGTNRPGPHEVVIGAPLARKLRATTGTQLRLITMAPSKAAFSQGASGTAVRVAGIYHSGVYDFDEHSVFIGDADMRSLFGIKAGTASKIYVRLGQPELAQPIKADLRLIPRYQAYAIVTWGEQNGDFFAGLKIQKFMLFVILLLIIIVAAFNIIGTLVLMVFEKTRAVGILRAMGASQGVIARIFLINGVLIGLVGTLAGVGLGLVICYAVIPIIPIHLPESIYNLTQLPVKVKLPTVLTIMLCSMLICTLAALFPARQAAKLNPVEALRYD